MTWSYVVASNATGGPNASYKPTITGVQEHDLVVMAATCKGDGTDETALSMGVGWTLIAGVPVTNTADAGLYVWYAIAGAGGALPDLTITRITGGEFSVHYHRAFAYRSSSGAPTKGAHALAANLAAGSTATLSDGVSSTAAGALIFSFITGGGATTYNSLTATDPSAVSASTSSVYKDNNPEVDAWLQRVSLSSTAGTGYSYGVGEVVKSSVGSTGPIVWGKNSSTRKASVLAVSFEATGGTPPTTPQGTTTITDVAPGTTAATVTYNYSAGDATGFEYRIDGGTAASIGASPAPIYGLTVGTPYSVEVRAINAAGAGSWSAAYNFTTAAAGDADPPTLTGSVTFTSITQTSYTASWPAGSDNVGVTGYEYQIGSTAGAWTDAGNNLSAAITGRTAGTTETVYVRAYDAAGLRSTPAISGEVTLLAVVAGISVTDPLKNNTGAVLASQSGVRVAVLQAADLVSVHESAGLTTNASGMLSTINDAAITAGQQYHVAIKLADGSVGITGPITAS